MNRPKPLWNLNGPFDCSVSFSYIVKGVCSLIRPYCGGDEEGVLQVWNAALLHDPMDADVFLHKILLDPNFRSENLLLYEDGWVQGFLLTVRPFLADGLREATGWIIAFGVHPNAWHRGIGQKLLSAGLTQLKNQGAKKVSFATYAPYYVVPGLDVQGYPEAYRLLSKHGFTSVYFAVAMDIALKDFYAHPETQALERQRQAEGYQFLPLTLDFVVPLFDFVSRQFSSGWVRSIREALARGVPLHQIWLVHYQGEVVGFAMYGGYDHVIERFGPFGVDELHRGRGLGKILLHRVLFAMRQKGLHNAFFLWTHEEDPAAQLYHKTGFKITRHFTIMEKTLD